MPSFDFEKLREERRRREVAFEQTRALNSAEQQRETFSIEDALLAVPRGVEAAFQDAYGLADTIFFDALPDYDERFLGESRTTVGGFVEGLTNFAAGFVPVVGVLGKVGKGGRALNLSKSAAAAARAAGKTKKAVAIEAGRFALAGAITDFTVFDGHEARLSNLIQAFPGLQNGVTEFLAADSDDHELVGRLKQVIEGAGVGLFAEAIVLGVRAIRAGRKVREAGGSPAKVDEAVEGVATDEEFADALGRAFDEPGRADGDVIDELLEPQATSRADDLAAQTDPEPGVVPPEAQRGASEVLDEEVLGKTRGGREMLLRDLGLDEGGARGLLDAVETRSSEGLLPTINPRAKNPDGTFVHSTDELLALRLERTDLNLSAYQGPEGALRLLRTYEDLFRGTMEADVKSLQRPQTWTEQMDASVAELGDIVQRQGLQSLKARLQRRLVADVEMLPRINARIRAYKALMVNYGAETARLAKRVKPPRKAGSTTDKIDEEALLQFADASEFMADLMAGVKGLLAEQGRGLQSNRIPVADLVFDRAAVDAALKSRGGRDKLLELAEKWHMAWDEGGVAGAASVARLAEQSTSRRGLNIVTEYWINSILSGGKTATVNALGGVLTSIYRPLESMVGGALTLRADVIADAFREMTGLAGAFQDSFRFAKKALRTGDAILDPHVSTIDLPAAQRRAITPEKVGLDPDSLMGQGLAWLGRLIRVPSHILQGTDDLIKQMNYRSSARSQMIREAISDGKTAAEAAEIAVGKMDELIYKGQAYSSAQLYRRGLDEAAQKGIRMPAKQRDFARDFARENFDPEVSALSKFALDHAREVTFTKELRPGSLSASVQNFVNTHPMTRLIMPFVRTPINILTFTGQRLDGVGAIQVLAAKRFPAYAERLASSQRRIVMDGLSSDPRRKADAVGRFAAGAGIAAWGFQMATSGAITGRGPSDPEQRKLLQQAGWLPYSIRTENGYVSYRRLDPFATLIGTFADIADFGRYADEGDQDGVEQLVYGVAAALAHNFTNKSYLTGLSNFVEALTDPERKAPRLIQALTSSFIPSAGAQSVTAAGDENLRDVNSILDAMRNRVPGLSDELPPMRNVLGEPIKRIRSLGSDTIGSITDMVIPIAYREVSDDTIFREMAELKHGFTPPKKSRNGLNLLDFSTATGQNAYDRWLQLHGQVKLRGNTLRGAMLRLIRSRQYQRLSPVSTHDVDSPRVALLNNMIQDYRRAAYRELLREIPGLNVAERNVLRQRRALSAGREQRPAVLSNLTGNRPLIGGN